MGLVHNHFFIIFDRYQLSVALNQLGDVQQESSDLDGALENYRRSAGIREELGMAIHRTRSIERVADVLMRRGEREPAVSLYLESLAVRRAAYAENPQLAKARIELALSLERQGDLAIGTLRKARAFFDEALALPGETA